MKCPDSLFTKAKCKLTHYYSPIRNEKEGFSENMGLHTRLWERASSLKANVHKLFQWTLDAGWSISIKEQIVSFDEREPTKIESVKIKKVHFIDGETVNN